ncbi:tape measure protein [Empedobacter brevis]|uniref:tape measure protein n=1 Tax=Empedobacter brevis TaxID=247 RepID=UPI00289905ED|nr:tape measure protein [Empedobacter brevis]
MDISNGRLGFTQDLDNQKFLNALRQSNRGVTDFNAHLQSNFNQSLISVNDLAKGVTAFLTIDMARDFITQMVKIRGEFEQTEIAFNTMLQSREKGNALMQEMVELAKNTPMQFSEVSKGAKQLLAYQVEAEKLTETLSMLGDISSGLGVPISRLILVYGQVRAKGRLMGDDLRQFTEAGVPMISMIAKNMGIAESAVADMVSEGKVGFKDVEKVLQDLTAQGGLFYNMMEEQSKTIPGQIAKLQDEIEQMFNEIGKDSQGFVTDVISGASVIVENYESIGKTLGVLIGTYGAYKAALITVSAIESARAKTVYSELESLSRKDRVQLLLTERSVRHAQATLAEAQAENVKNQAVLTTMRTDVSSLAVKKQKAIASAIEARNNVIEIQSKLANARAELTAIETTGTARQISIAQKKVERLENGLIDAQEKQSISRKAALGQTQAFNNAQLQLENQAKKTSIAQTAVANAQEGVSVAAKNLNTAATARLTIFQNLQVVSTKAWTKAQAVLNATMLTNPYVLLTVAVIGLTAAITKMILQATYAEEIHNKLNETLSTYRQNVAATEAEIQTLVEAIKSENTTNEEKESLLKKIVNITDGKIQNLSVEKIKTGELDAQLQAYIQTLYKQAEAEAYLEDIKELTKKKAANNDRKNKIQKDGPGFWESAESLIDANSWKNGNYKEILRSDHDFGKTIIKNIDAENAAIDEAIKERKKLVTEKVVVDKEIIKEPSGAAGAVKDSKKKSTSSKKSDDPFEIYKKQIQSVKEDYERFVDYMNSDDLVLKNFGKIQYETLSKSGATYEDYLRKVQKQLVGVTNKTSLQVKQLRFINDELAKTIEYNAFDKYKESIENEIELSGNLLEVIGKIQEEKSKLQGNTDQISIDKLKFLDEKEIENIKKADDAVKDLIITLSQESKPLDAINKKFDAQLFLLKKKVNDANDEIGKLTISANSSTDSNERIKIEERILKLKKEILDTQNLIDFNESKRVVETKNVTNNTDYNKLLSEYQSYEDKIKAIDDKMKADLLTNQNYYESEKLRLIQQGKDSEIKVLEDIKKAKDAQIKKQATDETSDIAKSQLMDSDAWANLFSDMDTLTLQQLDTLILQIEKQFDRLKGKFNPIDLKAIQKQLQQARNIVIQKNPFYSLGKSIADVFKKTKEGTNEDTETIITKWKRVEKSTEGVFDFLNEAIESSSVLKEFLGDTATKAMETVRAVVDITSGVLQVAEMTKNAIKGVENASVILAIISAVIQIATKIANLLSNIFSKDKKREKQIKEHKKSVDELTNAYKDLEDAVKRALGSDVYSGQKQMIENLKQQQIEYQKMIELEKGKKKKDSGKIKEWEDAIRDSKNTIQDLLEEIAEDVVQTNAKDLATELGDALVEAFGKGEDAAKAFGEVANNVLKNAVLNQLKKQFLEKQLQAALDKLYKDMGGDDEGNFNWNGLSPEEQQEFRDKLKEISQNFTGMLDEYSDLFKDLVDPNESSLSGAIKGVSEETASLIAGQINAMRLLIVEANQSRIETNRILIQSLERLANIDFNTKAANLMLEKMYSFMLNFKDNTRSYGF